MHGHINVKFVYEAYSYSYMMAKVRRALLNPLNAELNSICHMLTLLAHTIFHISRIRVKKRPLAAFRHSMPCFCNRSL